MRGMASTSSANITEMPCNIGLSARGVLSDRTHVSVHVCASEYGNIIYHWTGMLSQSRVLLSQMFGLPPLLLIEGDDTMFCHDACAGLLRTEGTFALECACQRSCHRPLQHWQVEHSAPSKVCDQDEEYSVAAGVGHVAQDMQRVRGDASWGHIAGSWPSFY